MEILRFQNYSCYHRNNKYGFAVPEKPFFSFNYCKITAKQKILIKFQLKFEKFQLTAKLSNIVVDKMKLNSEEYKHPLLRIRLANFVLKNIGQNMQI